MDARRNVDNRDNREHFGINAAIWYGKGRFNDRHDAGHIIPTDQPAPTDLMQIYRDLDPGEPVKKPLYIYEYENELNEDELSELGFKKLDGWHRLANDTYHTTTYQCAKENYSIISNKLLFETMQPIVDAGLATFDSSLLLGSNGERICLSLKLKEGIKLPNNTIAGYLSALNSHDGSLAFLVDVWTERLECRNMFPNILVKHRGLKVKHTGKAEDRAKSVVDYAHKSLESMSKLGKLAERLSNYPLTMKQYKEFLMNVYYPDSDLTKQDVINNLLDKTAITKTVETYLTDETFPELESENSGNWWRALNSVTHHLTHVRGGQSPERVKARFAANLAGGRNRQVAITAFEYAMRQAETKKLSVGTSVMQSVRF